MPEKWPPEYLNKDLAELGRLILHFNSVERHTSGVLRQLIADSFKDRAVLVLCENLSGVQLERNLTIFAREAEVEYPDLGLVENVEHLIKIYQDAKSIRNRIVHELGNFLRGDEMILSKHHYNKDGHNQIGLILSFDLLEYLVNWLREASEYSAKIGIEISFIRGLRDRGKRTGWPSRLDRISWRQVEEKFAQR